MITCVQWDINSREWPSDYTRKSLTTCQQDVFATGL